jgi:enoyl-CoA hydratase/carnithine racemase
MVGAEDSVSATVQYRVQAGVARIRLAAPASGNSLNVSLIEGIRSGVCRANDDASCRVIVLSASGREFCNGLDLNAVLPETPDFRKVGPAYLDCLCLIHRSAKPVIACVEGNVTGGGAGLVAACDLVLAGEHVMFSLPEAVIGMIPAVVTPFLLLRMQPARAQYLALSTRNIGAPEAKSFGLVDEVVSGEMEPVLKAQLRRLFRSSPQALAEIKRYFEHLHGQELNRQLQIAYDQFQSWVEQPGVIAGVRTFAEGFAPPWFEKYGEHADAE